MRCNLECGGDRIAAAAAVLLRIDAAEQVPSHPSRRVRATVEVFLVQAGGLGPEEARGLRLLCRRGDGEVLVVGRAYPGQDQTRMLGAHELGLEEADTGPIKGYQEGR
jgi:hypothetical protein